MQKKLAYILCTCAGAGYFPFASGTFASFLAILILYLGRPDLLVLTVLILLSSAITIYFSAEIEKNDGKDPQHIVMDEIAGQWLTFLFIPNPTLPILAVGFFLFRIFDVSKILGINRLQNANGGWGVLLDDLLAGLYSNIVIQILIAGDFIT